MALGSTGQDDFSGGMYRGRKAPANAAYDLVNLLINDEGLPFRRGGSAFKSDADAGGILRNVADTHVFAGGRTLFSSDSELWELDSDDQSPLAVDASQAWMPHRRLVAAGGAAFMPGTGTPLLIYGGARAPFYATGTVTVATGSKTVTGSGTAWNANAEPGMLLVSGDPTSDGVGIVETVNSNTSITLAHPWGAAPLAADPYFLNAATGSLPFALINYLPAADGTGIYLASIGASQRLVVGVRQRAYMSRRGDPFTFAADEYLELPSDAEIIGADSFQGSALLFTTRGIWALSNLDFDAVDAFGNIQWSQQQINKDIVLWADAGIAGWGSALVIPAVDDVYLFAGEAPVPITGSRGSQYDGGIRDLYRSYVKAGYQLGLAAVHRAHYILPVLNGSTLVDVLVCRLDRGFAWSRLAGHAAGVAYTQRVGTTSREPKLFGLAGQRVTDLTGCFSPTGANVSDADGSGFMSDVITRDYATGQQPGFIQRARLRYELEDGGTPDPAVTIAFSSDQDGGVFTDLTERGEQGGAAGWTTSDGSRYQWALVGKRRERIRFRVRVTGACSRFVLRSLELLTRPQGRQ